MRTQLASGKEQRKKFRATFSRFGKKAGYHGYAEETILLKNVIDLESNKVVSDHVWFNYTKGFEKISLEEGIQVEFEARIKKYTKGYINRKYGIDRSKQDYKLSYPTGIKIFKKQTQ